MTGKQRTTMRALEACCPTGTEAQPDPYTTADGDAIYGDGSILVHYTIPSPMAKPERFLHVGTARISADGGLVQANFSAPKVSA